MGRGRDLAEQAFRRYLADPQEAYELATEGVAVSRAERDLVAESKNECVLGLVAVHLADSPTPHATFAEQFGSLAALTSRRRSRRRGCISRTSSSFRDAVPGLCPSWSSPAPSSTRRPSRGGTTSR